MMMNCERSRNSRSTADNRAVFASSRAASTSSSRQNGAGFERKMANRSATAVRVFSPPLIRAIERSSLPGGRATTSMPLSSGSFSSSSVTSAMPPPNSLRNNSWK